MGKYMIQQVYKMLMSVPAKMEAQVETLHFLAQPEGG